MSISAVAFVPAAPLLVPEVAGGSAGLDAELRSASLGVVREALGCGVDDVVVVACSAPPGEWSEAWTWDFAGFGVPRRPADPRPALPWSLSVGAWLLDECGWSGPRRYVGVDGPAPLAPEAPAPAAPDRRSGGSTAVVVVADGSACRSERAPGHLDPRAERFDLAIADLLARGDVAGLGAVDAALAEQLMCRSLPAWAWAVGCLGDAVVSGAELTSHVAPYGVGYFVALWSFG